jgi:hypothetical protein
MGGDAMNHDPDHLDEINLTFVIISLLMIFLANSARAESRQLSLIGITVHGTPTGGAVSKSAMRNKITSDGFMALNPQLNYTFNYSDGTFYNTTALIDCYGQIAGMVSYGKKYKVESYLNLGYMVGIYGRLFPSDENLRLGKIGAYQFLPFPALIAEYRISKTSSFRMSSNYLINFFDYAWEF